MKKFLAIFLSLCTGLIFIFSAYSKLFPIEPFEYNIVGTTFIGWKLSVIVARLIIGIEFFIGALLVFSYNHKRIIPIALVVLLIFSAHLGYVLIAKGNTGDCGCFGNSFSMTPLQGLLKNAGLILILWLVYRSGLDFKIRLKHLEFYVLLVSLTTVFVINPVDYNYSENYLNKPFDNFPLELDTVYKADLPEKIGKPALELRKGKFIVAFMSSTCRHCRIAAQKFSVINRENPSIPIYFFINGSDSDIQRFRSVNEVERIPYSKLNGHVFVELAGLQLPVIYYLNNSVVEQQVDYYTLEQAHIEKWLAR
jgi:hypothetical protein